MRVGTISNFVADPSRSSTFKSFACLLFFFFFFRQQFSSSLVQTHSENPGSEESSGIFVVGSLEEVGIF